MNTPFNARSSLPYQIIRTFVRVGLEIFFKHHVVVRKFELPQDKPIIFIANHQNAFLDALLIICNIHQQPYALARADVFTINWLRKVLSSLRIAPVYRMRDGRSKMGKNDQVFQDCFELLRNNGSLLIFPEGNHGDAKRLRKLKSGTARIALGAVENGVEDVLIVPVGIEYSNKHQFRSNTIVQFGKPIQARDFYHGEDSKSDIRKLNRKLTDALKQLIVHIEEDEELVLRNWNIQYPVDGVSKYEFVENIQSRIEGDTSKNVQLKVISYDNDELNPFSWVFYPILIIQELLLNKVKDDQFVGSFKLLSIIILFPLYTIGVSYILTLFVGDNVWGIGVVAFLFLNAIFWIVWVDVARKRKTDEIKKARLNRASL